MFQGMQAEGTRLLGQNKDFIILAWEVKWASAYIY